MKPLIGITAWRRTLDTYYGPDRLQTLATFYTDSVLAAGMTPVIFPAGMDPGVAPQLVSLVDGVLLSGGDDVDPGAYGESVTQSMRTDSDVDSFEIAVIKAARDQGKPLLAICRGLQILNVALGGTLEQEVTTPGGVHEAFTKDTTAEEMNARSHVVHFEPGSILSGMYYSGEAKVNTLHHQGVKDLAPGLVVEGRTEDGLIEAARCEGEWWALGVQWHPERMDGGHQALFNLFREEIEARAG